MRVFIFSDLLPEFPYKSFIMTPILKITTDREPLHRLQPHVLSISYWAWAACGSRRALANFARPRARTLVIVFFPQSHSTSFTQVQTTSVTNSNASSPRPNLPWRSRKSYASASVSVWFRGKERPNDEKRDFRFWRKWNESQTVKARKSVTGFLPRKLYRNLPSSCVDTRSSKVEP